MENSYKKWEKFCEKNGYLSLTRSLLISGMMKDFLKLTESESEVNVEAGVIKKKPAEIKQKFTTVIDDREINVNYQLVFGEALCSLRAYQDVVDNFLEGATRKQMREDYHDINEHQKDIRKFLKKYYWKQS